jgi:hypothetical protein
MANTASHRLIASMHAALLAQQSALAAHVELDRLDAFAPDEVPALHITSGDVDVEVIGMAPDRLTQMRTPVELDAFSAVSASAADALLVAAHAVIMAAPAVKAIATDVRINLITPASAPGAEAVHVRRARYEFTHFGELADLSK